ncbi:MAG: arsenate reductase (glutaredoxin) [Pirellulaceae bacterium]|nr:arsenate reductase (glutaredoxin) [Pirellulaceae bacterium]
MKIYHNPRCSKSRQTLAMIEEAGVPAEVVLYLEEPPTAVELEEILDSLGMEPAELMRKGEAVYAELGLPDRELDRAEAIEIMVTHPALIERPIVVKAGQAIIGRPPENVQQLL